jgi:hypothetical protein
MKWMNAKRELPKEDGRYLVMLTFNEPVIMNDSIRRTNIPSVSNFRIDKGFLASMPDYEITHWMRIPELPIQDEFTGKIQRMQRYCPQK